MKRFLFIIIGLTIILYLNNKPLSETTSFGPDEILRKMVEIYGGIFTYQDEGYVEVTSSAVKDKIEIRRYFKTYFVRSGLFRFELKYQLGPKGPERHETLIDEGGKIHILSDGHIENVANIKEGLAKLAGVSYGSSNFVPSLLLKLDSRDILLSLKEKKIESAEEKDNEPYWVISGKHPQKNTFYELWVRKKDFILYKIKWATTGHYGPPLIIEETHLNILINNIISKTK